MQKKVAIPLGWIFSLLLFMTHISIILSNVQALYNNRAVTILILMWSSSIWPLWTSHILNPVRRVRASWALWTVLRSSPICKCILSIYLSIPTTLPPFTWVTINRYINRKVVLLFQFSMMDLSEVWTTNLWIRSHPLYHLSYQPLTPKDSLLIC